MIPGSWSRFMVYGGLLAASVIAGVLYGVHGGNIYPEPSVILFVGLESTRADHIGPCYGYNRTTAPNLCALAADGVRFEQAYATGPSTMVSVPPFFAARTPKEVGIKWIGGEQFSDTLTLFPHILARHGWTLRADTPQRFVDVGLLSGFEIMEQDRPVEFSPHTREFVFIYGGSTHNPYAPPERFRHWDNLSRSSADIPRETPSWKRFVNMTPLQTVIALYDGAIREVDAKKTGRTIQHLREAGLYRDALIVVFGDHGEAFGEHGEIAGHGGPPYQEVIHVPLVIKFPGNRFAGTRVSEPVSLVDVPHTLFDYLGLRLDAGSVGSSLLPMIGKAADGFDRVELRFFEADDPVFAAAEPLSGWMVREGDYTYILSNVFDVCVLGREPGQGEPWSEHLYHLENDPGQQHDIAAEHPERVQELRAELCRVFNTGERNPDWFINDSLSEEAREELAQLATPYLER